ncbi:MAG: glycosyltransferase family 25 protein [Chlamydiales bacterium]|nr:glycosyltransferase family 25 protein [Chlamydiales bacterium]
MAAQDTTRKRGKMNNRVLLASLLSSSLLLAGLSDYFKNAPNKGSNHCIENIDFIYMLNLDQRPEKYEASLKQLEPYGIHPYRFSAVNGWELPLETVQDVGLKYRRGMQSGIMGTSYLPEDEGRAKHSLIEQEGMTYFCHCMARGPIGICLSHLSILADAVKSGYKTIWVMEDDIQVIRDPRLMSQLVAKLDQQVGESRWDVLFTDRDTKNQRGEYVPCSAYAKRPNYEPRNPVIFQQKKNISPEFRRIGSRYGAYSMIIRRSGMEKILSFFLKYKIFFPYDMDYYAAPGLKVFTVREDVVSTLSKAISDNGGPNYLNKKKLTKAL